MEGFFKPSEMRIDRRKFLPPVLKIELPPTEAVKKKKFVYESPKIPQIICDTECYENYWLAKFRTLDGDITIEFERTAEKKLDTDSLTKLLKKYEVITFNGTTYDIPMIRLALTGASNAKLKKASDDIIKCELSVWKFEDKYKLNKFKIKHIDLIELCIGRASLKIYGGRLHCEKMQELPIEEGTTLSENQMQRINTYCGNDLDVTKLVFFDRHGHVELRRAMSQKYKLDLMSKSDAQIAEAVIKSEIERISGKELSKLEIEKRSFYYQVPSNIIFRTEQLKRALYTVTTNKFEVSHKGAISMPKELADLKIKIGSSTYNMGMGGLHSTEKLAYHLADDEHTLHDWDVTSYYPSIILKCGLYPKQLGKKNFLGLYENIFETRIRAKAEGDKVTADALKTVLNGSFGKFGSPYSVLYAPDLMIQVTVSGQLYLLMLIEMLEERGISVVSGNTDGIVIKCPKDKDELMRRVIKHWEKRTGFDMEETRYAGIYSRDVNNYIAIKENGEVKTKGTFTPSSIGKNPDNEICALAMIEYLKFGTPFEHTVKSCFDITKFVTVRQVNGGALKDGRFLGKAVRFYHAKGVKGAIKYKTSGNDVPLSEGAKPIMNISGEFPNDIDYDWYIERCFDLF